MKQFEFEMENLNQIIFDSLKTRLNIVLTISNIKKWFDQTLVKKLLNWPVV